MKTEEHQKDANAVALGRKGGKAGAGTAKARTSEQARATALARWAKAVKKSHKELMANKLKYHHKRLRTLFTE